MLVVLVATLGCRSQPGSSSWTAAWQQNAEALAGARAAAELESTHGGIFCCPERQARLERIGSEVAVHSELHEPGMWHFRLLGSDTPNAFALPTRRIYLTRGLYERIGDDDALIAAAVAHEIAHLQRRDCFKPDCASADERLGREHAADLIAVELLRRASYPPESLSRLLRLIDDVQPHGWAEARVRYIDQAS